MAWPRRLLPLPGIVDIASQREAPEVPFIDLLTQEPLLVDLLTQVPLSSDVASPLRSRRCRKRPLSGKRGHSPPAPQALCAVESATTGARSLSSQEPSVAALAASSAVPALAAPRGWPHAVVAVRASRPCRYGRCRWCSRALRPGITLAAEPLLRCSNSRGPGQHTWRIVHDEEASRLGFPKRILRRVRVAF